MVNCHSLVTIKQEISGERNQSLKGIPQSPFRSNKLGKSIWQTSSKTRLSLNPHLHCLHGAKSNICNYLSRCRTSKVNQGLVLGCILWPSNVRVILLEEFIKSKLASTLCTISKKGRHPTPKKAPNPLLLQQNSKSRWNALVLCRVDLNKNNLNFRPMLSNIFLT